MHTKADNLKPDCVIHVNGSIKGGVCYPFYSLRVAPQWALTTMIKVVLMTHTDKMTSHLYLLHNMHVCVCVCVSALCFVVFISMTSWLASRLLTHSVHRDTNIASQSQPTHFIYCSRARLRRHFLGTGKCHLLCTIVDWQVLYFTDTSIWSLPTPAERTSHYGVISLCFQPSNLRNLVTVLKVSPKLSIKMVSESLWDEK